jgi:hypothetical protein
VSGTSVTTTIVGDFEDAFSVNTLPTPGPTDVEMTEETTSVQDDSTYLIQGVIRNLNPFWTLEITELPTVQAIDLKGVVIETRPIQVASNLVPPRSEVAWSFRAAATAGRPATAFSRSDLKARWLHPDQKVTPGPVPTAPLP